MADVFLSYARENHPKAKAIAEALTAHGWKVWWDRKTPPGMSFDEVIERELTACKCAIVLWSNDSIKSKWVLNEAREADERDILVPVLVEDVRIPFAYRRIHAADLIAWDGTRPDDQWNEVVERVAQLAPRGAAPSTNHALPVTPPEQPSPAPPAGRMRSGILADEERLAINIAVQSQHPLLVIGGTGTGKTHLAETAAEDLGLYPPLVFETQSDSKAVDLLYQYDHIRRLHDAQSPGGDISVNRYLTLGPLGEAIARSSRATRSLVLIEDVDRGSRDFATDLAGYLRTMTFSVKEASELRFSANANHWPIAILTSTGQRHLPDGLLSACVYHSLAFPSAAHLQAIGKSLHPDLSGRPLDEAVEYFVELRHKQESGPQLNLSQFLTWLKTLEDSKSWPLDNSRETLDRVKRTLLRSLGEGPSSPD